MPKNRRHLIAAFGLGLLAMVCFGLGAWALIEGAVVANFPSVGRVRSDTAGHQYLPANTVYTRTDAPGVYWGVVGALGVLGTFFSVVAWLERRSSRTPTGRRQDEPANARLLAKFDLACRHHTEGRETLLRARAVLIELNSPAVELSLEAILDRVLQAPSRELAAQEIQNLAKALDVAARL